MKLDRKAALLFLISFAIYISLSLLVGVLLPENTSYTLQLIFYALGVSIPSFLLPAIFYRSRNDFAPFRVKKASLILLAIPIGIGCMFLNLSLSSLIKGLTYDIEFQSAALDVKQALNGSSIPLMLFTVVLIPAVSEEYLMRGALLETWRRTSPIGAAALTSLLFALLHLAPSYFLIYFAIGILLAIVYLITRNVWVTVTIHLINNLLSVISAFMYLGDDGGAASDAAAAMLTRSQCFAYFAYMSVLAAAILVPMVFVLRNYCRRNGIGAYSGETGSICEQSELAGGEAELLRGEQEQPSPAPNGRRGLFAEPLVWVCIVMLVMMNLLFGLVEFGVLDLNG